MRAEPHHRRGRQRCSCCRMGSPDSGYGRDSGCDECSQDPSRVGGMASKLGSAQWCLGVLPGRWRRACRDPRGREPPPLENGDSPRQRDEVQRPSRRGHPFRLGPAELYRVCCAGRRHSCPALEPDHLRGRRLHQRAQGGRECADRPLSGHVAAGARSRQA
jgi:hypothetical protein